MAIVTSVNLQEYDSASELFIFLLQYSFLFKDSEKINKTCTLKTTQFHIPQGNGENGARYLDPKYSRWISVDPALGEYVPSAGKSNEADKLPGMGGIFNSVNLSLYHYAGNNPIKYVDPDGCETMIIGVSISKNGIDLFGQHSFIMLLNDKAPSQNIMLDASGHFYANQHFNDVLRESAVYPRSISLNSYKNYWKGEKEYLFTFTIELEDKQASEFRTLIEKEDSERTWLTCATKSSRVLHKSELFKSIRETSKPKKLLKQLLKFFTTSELKVKIECHDLETTNSKEIKLKKTEDNK